MIATSAFRDATNAKEVCDIIQFETGFHVNIISGEEEAQLIYQGVKLSGAIVSDELLFIWFRKSIYMISSHWFWMQQ